MHLHSATCSRTFWGFLPPALTPRSATCWKVLGQAALRMLDLLWAWIGALCEVVRPFCTNLARVDTTAEGHVSDVGRMLSLRLISLAVGPQRAPSIRDVIAFPKSHTGTEVLSGAPSVVSEQVLNEFGLSRLPASGGHTGNSERGG